MKLDVDPFPWVSSPSYLVDGLPGDPALVCLVSPPSILLFLLLMRLR